MPDDQTCSKGDRAVFSSKIDPIMKRRDLNQSSGLGALVATTLATCSPKKEEVMVNLAKLETSEELQRKMYAKALEINRFKVIAGDDETFFIQALLDLVLTDLISYAMPSIRDFCGWTGLMPIALYKEFIQNKG